MAVHGHPRLACENKHVDARDKPAHDDVAVAPYFFAWPQYFWKYFRSGGGWFFWIGMM